MTTVLLVRHGRTQANAGGILAGRSPHVHLDDTGRAQVESLARRLDGLPVDAVVASPLERTRETAEILLAQRAEAALVWEDRLLECDYGSWTGKELSSLAKDPHWKVVQSHPSAAAFPGGETLRQMQHRAVDAVRDWNAQLGSTATYVMVSHGDVIKAILADALGMHLDAFQRLRVDPASLSVVQYTDLRPFVERMNDMGGSVDGLRPQRKGRRRRSSDAVVGGGSGA